MYLWNTDFKEYILKLQIESVWSVLCSCGGDGCTADPPCLQFRALWCRPVVHSQLQVHRCIMLYTWGFTRPLHTEYLLRYCAVWSELHVYFSQFLGAFAFSWKVPISFVVPDRLSVCPSGHPSVCLHVSPWLQLWMDFSEILYWGLMLKYVKKVQIWLK